MGAIFAFIASVLSVLSTVISYFIDRSALDANNVIQYYLVTNVQNRSLSPKLNTQPSSSLLESEMDASHATFDNNNQITKEEKIKIIINKGRRRKLAGDIAELFGIPRKNIQIGNSIITKHGVISHIVHFVSNSDLEQLGVALDEESVSIDKYIDMLYSSLSREVNQVCRRHFGLSDDFVV